MGMLFSIFDCNSNRDVASQQDTEASPDAEEADSYVSENPEEFDDSRFSGDGREEAHDAIWTSTTSGPAHV